MILSCEIFVIVNVLYNSPLDFTFILIKSTGSRWPEQNWKIQNFAVSIRCSRMKVWNFLLDILRLSLTPQSTTSRLLRNLFLQFALFSLFFVHEQPSPLYFRLHSNRNTIISFHLFAQNRKVSSSLSWIRWCSVMCGTSKPALWAQISFRNLP